MDVQPTNVQQLCDADCSCPNPARHGISSCPQWQASTLHLQGFVWITEGTANAVKCFVNHLGKETVIMQACTDTELL